MIDAWLSTLVAPKPRSTIRGILLGNLFITGEVIGMSHFCLPDHVGPVLIVKNISTGRTYEVLACQVEKVATNN